MVQMRESKLFNMLCLPSEELEHLAIDKVKLKTYNSCAKMS